MSGDFGVGLLFLGLSHYVASPKEIEIRNPTKTSVKYVPIFLMGYRAYVYIYIKTYQLYYSFSNASG
jgi:hypothetical protein